jgi:hypothetical protein
MRKRMVPVIVAAIAIASASWIAPLSADQTIQCVPNGTTQTTCTIREPNVRQKVTPYPEVTLQTGDRVTVSAGGCVQTGGAGATWKRYVNPSGPNADHLYFGTISIPGATSGLVRISQVVGQTLTVGAGTDHTLQLGYVDDDYGDNGFDSHDDGTENQCKNSVNAFVTLVIVHPTGTIGGCGGTTGTKDLDLVWTECDPNGFPLNPRWRYQANHNNNLPAPPELLCPKSAPVPSVILFYPTCTSWQVTTDSGFWCGPHVNFFAATYVAPFNWGEKSTNGTDDDYNYRLFPPNNAGVIQLTDLSANGMEIEHDSEETIDHFSSPIWSEFHSEVKNDNAAAQKRLTGKTAVVTGLFGLDCGHPSCASEMHPAYALALNWDDSDLANDTWAVFARNWGNEGFCSDNQHDLQITDLKVLIPWRPGATSVTVLPDTAFYPFANSGSAHSIATPTITTAAGQGVLIDFTLPDPSQQSGLHGEVYLKWGMGRTRPIAGRPIAGRPIIGQPLALATAIATAPKADRDKPEDAIGALVAHMSAPQRQIFRTHLPVVAPASVATAKLPSRTPISVAKLPAPPAKARLLVPTLVPDPRLTARAERLRTALCAAYGNAVPGYPAACAAHPTALRR